MGRLRETLGDLGRFVRVLFGADVRPTRRVQNPLVHAARHLGRITPFNQRAVENPDRNATFMWSEQTESSPQEAQSVQRDD